MPSSHGEGGVALHGFAPTRALRQLSEYGIGLSPNEPNPENAVKELVSFLPVLAYDGANMTQISGRRPPAVLATAHGLHTLKQIDSGSKMVA